MKTIISGPSQSKVTFINPNKAKVELTNGETYFIGFPGPYSYISGGEHLIPLLGWLFDLYRGTQGSF